MDRTVHGERRMTVMERAKGTLVHAVTGVSRSRPVGNEFLLCGNCGIIVYHEHDLQLPDLTYVQCQNCGALNRP